MSDVNVLVRQLIAHEADHDPLNPERSGSSAVTAELASGTMYYYDYSYDRSWSWSKEVFDDGQVRVEITRRNGKRTVKLLIRPVGKEVWWREGSQVSVLPISADE